ncbi:MAG: L-threonylcarbamoyladenylate synthase [Thermoplasmataceae archaeon]
MTQYLESDCANFKAEDIEYASKIIINNGTVIFPTETVYGIGANALSDSACQKIFKAKDRPVDNPLIVHVSSVQEVEKYARTQSIVNFGALSKLWPGPLTIILPSTELISNVARAGLDTVAIRIPDCNLALELIRKSGVPIAAPSANISTKPSITGSEHLRRNFDGKVDVIFNGGRTKFGIESTVIYPQGDTCVIMRPGIYTEDDFKAIFKHVIFSEDQAENPKSPGTKYRHYSPEKNLYMPETQQEFLGICRRNPKEFTPICSYETSQLLENVNAIILGKRENPYEIASNLYESLIKFDQQSGDQGIIEPFYGNGIYLSIMNRIKKAAISVKDGEL